MATITQETIDSQNAVLKIKVTPQDYEPLLNEALRKLSKKIELKGFRRGFVPVGHVRKLYGNEVLAEELNNLINREISRYLAENKVEILGQPLPHPNGDKIQLDINEKKEYEFAYDLGLNPMFELTALVPETQVTRYEVVIDDKLIDKEISALQKRYGEVTNPEDGVQPEDTLVIKFAELNDALQVKENGVQSVRPVPLSRFSEPLREQWIGKKPGEYLDVELMHALQAEEEEIIHHYLQLKEHRPLEKHFRLQLEKIIRIKPAELNQEFFDKVFGKERVTSVEAFRDELRKELQEAFATDAGHLLNKKIVETLLAKTYMQLPDAFLKRWLRASSENPLTDADLEREYPEFAKSLKWTLIRGRIAKDNNLVVSREEIKAYLESSIRNYYHAADSEENNKLISDLALEMMKNEEHLRRATEAIVDQKVMEFIKSKISIVQQQITAEEFNKLT
ncbi:MAG: peptidylprolyl isomerase [Chitinophagales bacterium]|nr:MAG: peptidylprolyl isomerase [Chitinophagales bacterium]